MKSKEFQQLMQQFKVHIKKMCKNPKFIHNEWYVKYHLEIVEKLADELLNFYPSANKDLVTLIVWLHDYGKIIDYAHQHETTLTAGRQKLIEIGFPEELINRAVDYIYMMDKKEEIAKTPIEIQIVSSADGCSHLAGPFFSLWWKENPNRTCEQLMANNVRKATVEWDKKVVLPEARHAFQARHNFLLEQSGHLPKKYI